MTREIHLVIEDNLSSYTIETFATRRGVKTGGVKSTYYKGPKFNELLNAGLETHYGFVKDMLSHE